MRHAQVPWGHVNESRHPAAPGSPTFRCGAHHDPVATGALGAPRSRLRGGIRSRLRQTLAEDGLIVSVVYFQRPKTCSRSEKRRQEERL